MSLNLKQLGLVWLASHECILGWAGMSSYHADIDGAQSMMAGPKYPDPEAVCCEKWSM